MPQPVPDPSLSVVIPVYNGHQWVAELVRRVQLQPWTKEILLVDDGSTDGTIEILEEIQKHRFRGSPRKSC